MTKGGKASGLLIALAGFALLSVGDAIVKSMAGQWPGTAIATLRYAAGTAGLAIALALTRGRAGFRCPLPMIQLGRGIAITVATLCFFLAIFLMPLAEATAIAFVSPMIVATASSALLGERTPPAAWAAIGIAFAGVLLILRPNIALLGLPALLPLAAACGLGATVLLNRRVAGQGPVLQMQFLAAAFATPLLLSATLIGHLSGHPSFHVGIPEWTVVARTLFIACSATLAHSLIFMGTLRASAAATAPMTYVQLLVAAGAGWAIFGETPDLPMIAGAALIIGGGLWLWRSQRIEDAGGAPD